MDHGPRQTESLFHSPGQAVHKEFLFYREFYLFQKLCAPLSRHKAGESVAGGEKVHVFPYSRRAGTRAAEFPDVVENAEKERRSREMIATAGEVRHEFLERQIGRTVEVLFEEKLRDGSIQGYTANYTPVRIKSGCTHGLHKVKITACGDDWCEGELI